MDKFGLEGMGREERRIMSLFRDFFAAEAAPEAPFAAFARQPEQRAETPTNREHRHDQED